MASAVNNLAIKEVFRAAPHLLRLPSKHIWVDYDQEADVLYVSFEKPQRATDSELVDKNILLRYRDSKLVGITIMHARSYY